MRIPRALGVAAICAGLLAGCGPAGAQRTAAATHRWPSSGTAGASAPAIPSGGPPPAAASSQPSSAGAEGQAEKVAAAYITAMHSLTWKDPRPDTWLSRLRATTTASYFTRIAEPVRQAVRDMSAGDRAYWRRLKTRHTVQDVTGLRVFPETHLAPKNTPRLRWISATYAERTATTEGTRTAPVDKRTLKIVKTDAGWRVDQALGPAN